VLYVENVELQKEKYGYLDQISSRGEFHYVGILFNAVLSLITTHCLKTKMSNVSEEGPRLHQLTPESYGLSLEIYPSNYYTSLELSMITIII
jgi:hypothetical protein